MHPKALFRPIGQVFRSLRGPLEDTLHWLWASPKESYTTRPGQTMLTDTQGAERLTVWFASTYTPEISAQIHKAKYGGDWPAALGLTKRMRILDRPQDWAESGPLLVPMAPDPQRLVRRGFHLPALLASALGRHWRIPVWRGGLIKVRSTPEQARRSRAERQKTEAGLIAWNPKRNASKRQVILVDDVMTTGATLRAALQALDAKEMPVLGAVVLAYVPFDRATQSGDARSDAHFKPVIAAKHAAWHHRLWERTEGVR